MQRKADGLLEGREMCVCAPGEELAFPCLTRKDVVASTLLEK